MTRSDWITAAWVFCYIFGLYVAARLFGMRFTRLFNQRSNAPRGFEVKLTGKPPVEQRKDNDHG